MAILSSFTRARVVPNLYDFLSSVEHKIIYFEECFDPCNESHWDNIETHWPYRDFFFFKISSFVVYRTTLGWVSHDRIFIFGSKWHPKCISEGPRDQDSIIQTTAFNYIQEKLCYELFISPVLWWGRWILFVWCGQPEQTDQTFVSYQLLKGTDATFLLVRTESLQWVFNIYFFVHTISWTWNMFCTKYGFKEAKTNPNCAVKVFCFIILYSHSGFSSHMW